MADKFAFLLLLWTCRAVVSLFGVSKVTDSNPVGVGDTATFTCTFERIYTDPVFSVKWYNNRRFRHTLLLKPGKEPECVVHHMDPTLSNFTFQYTCERDIFTLSIVGVTKRDIDFDHTWCCRVVLRPLLNYDHGCGSITKATNESVLPMDVTTDSVMVTLSTTEKTSEKPAVNISFDSKPGLSSTFWVSMFLVSRLLAC